MENWNKDQVKELKRLEDIATEKRIIFQRLDNQLFGAENSDDPSLLPEYTKAKAELIEAVHQYNVYRTSLSK